ncbi:metallo-beta-lactamase family protein (macronuclear) [Tetrahymena thermophila SB210]|uniref:Metallo-beta-lactamase family protein n=1 Tax=Tetrahymena thermophila (strain SB210) TaxID=312017 RepID=Q22YX3_TETTS|nr:metallo-beta-lactamase family protein [Tetrahymena thermophila SB210]EAR90548.2 metallo-beta-lactamase family protein [Tetrahymena thermophila SB210]|eukprot:XP_001010793.2 metallo-beta-lactamase family protein [Tetrahymena thermophila SB210]
MDPKLLVKEGKSYYIQQFFTGCLAEMAYYIESDKVAVIIDPMRDYQRYIDLLNQRGATLKYVIETHFHADFVSSHLDIAKITGATIVFGPTASPKYEIKVASDEEILEIGSVKLQVLHTPGHTPESSCYLLLDENNTAQCVFTGDTLFLGDVGRPDLACNSNVTKEDLAGQLFDSLRSKIFKLPRDIIVYPAHGAGSSCGKNISDGTFDTLENQFKTNWALQESVTREEFVSRLVKISAPPQYYFYDARINREGYESLDIVLERSTKALTVDQVKQEVQDGAIIVDGRSNQDYVHEFIPGSFFLSLGMPFAQWIGTLIKPETKLIIVAPAGQEKEAIVRLARIGYHTVLGYLDGGINAWKNAGLPLDHSKDVTAEDFVENLSNGIYAIDVRKPDELINGGSVKGLKNVELTVLEAELTKNPNLFPKDQDLYIMCRSGQRSVVAISILKKFGYDKLINVAGGFIAVEKTGASEVVGPTCTN